MVNWIIIISNCLCPSYDEHKNFDRNRFRTRYASKNVSSKWNVILWCLIIVLWLHLVTPYVWLYIGEKLCVRVESLDLFYAAQGLTLLIFTQAVMARHARNATLLSAQEWVTHDLHHTHKHRVLHSQLQMTHTRTCALSNLFWRLCANLFLWLPDKEIITEKKKEETDAVTLSRFRDWIKFGMIFLLLP